VTSLLWPLNQISMDDLCQFEGCDAPVYVKTQRLCRPHYEKVRRQKRAANRKPPPPTVANDFWSNVDVTADTEKCWLWSRRVGANGYGGLRFEGRVVDAHRVSFFLTYGHWPKPMCLHSCDNPRFVNPNHLREGTQFDNMADASKRGRLKKQRSADNRANAFAR
jgi:hypothetical protein